MGNEGAAPGQGKRLVRPEAAALAAGEDGAKGLLRAQAVSSNSSRPIR
jgi:hypothetical protein